MVRFLLCLSALVLCSSGMPTDTADIKCPFLPCPLPPCEDPHPTYYMYHGKLCQGCSQCDTSRKVTCPYLPCPSLPCADSETYSTYYQLQGVLCEGCKQCRTYETPKEDHHSKRQQAHLPICPYVDCAYNPGPCVGGTLKYSTFHFNGYECRACPYCVSTTTATPQA